MSLPPPDGLRALARLELGTHGDPRAAEAIEVADIQIQEAIQTWEGISGTVRGHRVSLGLGAALLATVNTAPAVKDALHAAFAAAVARSPGESLSELFFFHHPYGKTEVPYRGGLIDTQHRVSNEDALRVYLETLGETELAAMAGRATIEISRGVATVQLAPDDYDRIDESERDAATLLGAATAVFAVRVKLAG